MSCKTACYESIIECCNDIIVRANFPANYSLYWIISKTGNSNIYQRLAVTDGNGDLKILKSNLPLGYLLPGNIYQIQVKNGFDYLQPVTFVFGGKQYTCILTELVTFNRSDSDNSEVNVIQFKEAIVPSSPAPDNSIVYAFANQTQFTYYHNLGRIVDVTIYDLSGEILQATIQDDIVNHNYITVTFTSPTSGRILIQ